MFLSLGWGWILLIVYVVVMLIFGFVSAKVRANKYYYSCSICGTCLNLTFSVQNNGMSGMIKMKCPNCKKTEWFVEIEKKKPRSLDNVQKDAKKIAIIGLSGSGKSTLAKKIANHFYLPLLHIDTINFYPNWVERPRNEVKQEVKQFLEEDAWVIDGNYSELYSKERLELADEIVILMFSKRTCLKQVRMRAKLYKGSVREDAADGCYENLDKDFKRWVVRDGRTRARIGRYFEIIQQYPNKTYLLKSRNDVQQYLQNKGIR